MKRMSLTRNLLLTGMAALALAFTACDSEEEIAASGDFDIEALDTQAESESTFDDIDDLSTSLFEETFSNNRRGRDHRLDCATKTVDSLTNTITVDFGEGCTDERGRVRAGQIIITQDGRRFEPGSVMSISFNNYSVDGVQVEGTRTLQNTSSSVDENPRFLITLDGGRLTWEDGTSATREVSRIKTWLRAANPLQDEWQIEGTVSGINRAGQSYSCIIVEPLVFARRCSTSRFVVPVSGIKEFSKGEELYLVDYGDGTCDRLATVTHEGVTEEIRLGRRFLD